MRRYLAGLTSLLAGFVLSAAAPAAAAPLLTPIEAANILHCFHPTGRYERHSIIEQPWSRAAAFGAETSFVVRIHYAGGITYHPYDIDLAWLRHEDFAKAVILQDTAVIPPNDACQLTQWTLLTPSPLR